VHKKEEEGLAIMQAEGKFIEEGRKEKPIRRLEGKKTNPKILQSGRRMLNLRKQQKRHPTH